MAQTWHKFFSGFFLKFWFFRKFLISETEFLASVQSSNNCSFPGFFHDDLLHFLKE